MYMFNPFIRTLGVISADYNAFDSSLSYEEINNHVCEEFRVAMRRFCKDSDHSFPVELNDNVNIIILWYNAPNPAEGKADVNKTLELLCQAPFYGTIYFRSIHDIIEAEGMEQLIHTIATLSQHGKKYIFLDNEYFSYKSMDAAIDFSNLEAEANQLAIQIATQAAAGKVLAELDRLVKRPASKPIDGFLDFYWKWQRAEIAAERCKEEIGIAHRTFYKYSQIYESTLYYAEHLKIFFIQIGLIAKRGALPDKEEYLSDINALEQGSIKEHDVCKKYGFLSMIDIQRTKIALTERRRNVK